MCAGDHDGAGRALHLRDDAHRHRPADLIYAVGGNAKAAKLSGIKTERLPTVNG